MSAPQMRLRGAVSGAYDLGEGRLARAFMIGGAVIVLAVLLLMPLATVFSAALGDGWAGVEKTLGDPDAISAIWLTLLVAAIAVPLNTIFGLAAGWAIARFRFRGRAILISIVDLPFSVSPVIAGLSLVLLFGAHGWFGPSLQSHHIKIIFALPGIVFATTFVTLPFVARQVIPVLEAQGRDEEEAALTLGAGGWTIFRRITLPNIRWGLLYGVLLCNARAMGEFGAVSVVSGRIRGLTDTMPLHIEILYDQYDLVGAFTVAALLALLAVLTLVAKAVLEWKTRAELAAAAQPIGAP